MSVTGMAGMLNLKGLTPELLPPAELYAGTVTSCRIRLNNSKRLFPSFLLSVSCQERQGGVTFPIVPANDHSSGTLPLIFHQRGPAQIGTVTISSTFPVNFFIRYWAFESCREVIVFPRLIPGSPNGSAGKRLPRGSAISQKRGHDGELEQIAPYSGREPLRYIHWKLSARGDDLLVKEFGSQTAAPLLVDPDALAGFTLDERVSKAAWLVRRWVSQRPVGLRLGARTITPAMGGHQLTTLMKELALYGLD